VFAARYELRPYIKQITLRPERAHIHQCFFVDRANISLDQ
jgi:hypothetical protein